MKNKDSVYGIAHVTKFSNDPEHQTLNFENTKDRNFKVEPDENIQGVAFVILGEGAEFDATRGVYIGKGPTTHSDLRSNVCCEIGPLPTPRNFDDSNFCYGFYSNKGYFYTRRNALILVEENSILTATPVQHINYLDGLLSTDVWGEDLQHKAVIKSSDVQTENEYYKPTKKLNFTRSNSYSPIGSKKKNKR